MKSFFEILDFTNKEGARNWRLRNMVKFNERLNDLANQGYSVSCTTDTYILLSWKPAAVRREE